MSRRLPIAGLLVLLFLVGPLFALQLPGRLVSAGKHKLWISCEGSGTPTVVIDVGIGGDPREWTRVVDDLRHDARVCQYERAGYGTSEPGPFPRDARREGEELLALLRNAGEKPPYLLVGHSLGGLNAFVFAGTHQDLLAGLALLEMPPLEWIQGKGFPRLRELADSQTAQFKNAADKMLASPLAGDRNRAPRFLAMVSEHQMMFSESAKQAAAVKSLGALPLLVVGAARPNPIFTADAEPYQKYWIEANRRLATMSSRGEFVLLEESGHMMHRDAPGRVADALRGLLARVRTRKAAP